MKVGKQGEKTGRFVEKVGRYEVKTGMQEVKGGGFRKKVHYFFDPKVPHSKKIQTFSSRTTRLSERKTLSLRLTKHNFPLYCRKATSIQCDSHRLSPMVQHKRSFTYCKIPTLHRGASGYRQKSEISKFSNAIKQLIQPRIALKLNRLESNKPKNLETAESVAFKPVVHRAGVVGVAR